MRIGELAQRTGVSQRSLRYYEEQGLLRPQRRPSGYREYDEADVLTVRRIRLMLTAGLNTAFIAGVLPCIAADDGRSDLDDAAPLCPELRDLLLGEHDRITAVIDELDAARTLLTAVVAFPRRLTAPDATVGRPTR